MSENVRGPRKLSMRILRGMLFFVATLCIGVAGAFAQEVSPFAKLIGVGVPDTRLLVLRILQIVWGIALASGVGLGIYGVMALRGGREEEDLVAQARGRKFLILGALIAIASGLLIVVISFIYGGIAGQYGAKGGAGGEKEASRAIFSGEYQSRLSRVEKHYPARDEKNIPRNVSILITFREAIDPSSITDENGMVIPSSIRLYEISPTPTPEGQGKSASVTISDDGKTITLRPDPLLGEPEKKSLYGVILSSEIMLKSGDSLFGNTGGYSWQFEVSGTVDTTPPTVQSALPIPPLSSKDPIARNALIQITFSEPIDPTVISGAKVVITNQTKSRQVEGSLLHGNNYRTITFIPKQGCGKNSCNEEMYCLPEDGVIQVVLKSATLLAQRSTENPYRAKFPYDGIVDASGNSFDGGAERGTAKNGKSEGPPSDNFTYSFAVGGKIELSTPSILSVTPPRDAVRVPVDTPVDITFSRFMDSTSLHQGSVFIANDISYWIESEHDTTAQRTRARVYHDPLREDTLYQPEVHSEAHDMYQNCFNPCLGPLP